MGTEYYTAIDGPAAETYICQATLAGVAEQKWTITKQNDGYYTVRSGYGSEKYMGVTGSGTGTNNVQLQSSVTDSARWKIYRTSGGSVLFEPKTAPGKTLYVPGTSSGTKYQLIQTYVYDSTSDKESVFYVTRGYGEQEFRPLTQGEYGDYNCLQYALGCIEEDYLPENWDYQFSSYAELWENDISSFEDENTSFYANVSYCLVNYCKSDFENLLSNELHFTFEVESSFFGNGDYRPLDINQYRVVLRTGIHQSPPYPEDPECVNSDYHFWYQTKDGTWANKHDGDAPVQLASGTTPSSTATSGWNNAQYPNYYDSQIYCYIITVS